MELIHLNLENQRDAIYTTSTITTEILEFYAFHPSEHSTNTELIDTKGQFNWQKLNELFVFNESSEYAKCVEKISNFNEILMGVYFFFRNANINELIEEFGEWTHRKDDLLDTRSRSGSDTNFVSNALIYTSILEYSLGNVFFDVTSGKSPPHLLSDLLISNEIKEVFTEIIPLMWFLVGTPAAVNLRNIVWHGFPRVYEFDETYADLVLLLILNLGNALKEKKIEIQPRPCTVHAIERMNLIEIHSDWMESKPITFLKVISSSRTLLDYHKLFWVRAIHLYLAGKYGQSLVLLLPQVEMMLRLLYGAANEVNISASHDKYYVTMDTIFDNTIPDSKQPNLFKKIMDDSTVSLMYDLFISPKGPRIRDLLSHGEIPLTAITEDTARKVFLFTFHIISQFDSIIELPTLITGYLAHFHPVSEFNRKVKMLSTALDDLSELSLPEELFPGSLLGAAREQQFPPAIAKYKELAIDKENCIEFLRGTPYYREFVKVLIQILDNSNEAATNFMNAMKTRGQEFTDHTLSSARRKTYDNMVKHFDEICLGLIVVLCICKKVNFEELFKTLSDDEEILLKKLKKVLKCTENLKKYLQIQNNAWESACEVTKQLRELFVEMKEGQLLKRMEVS